MQPTYHHYFATHDNKHISINQSMVAMYLHGAVTISWWCHFTTAFCTMIWHGWLWLRNINTNEQHATRRDMSDQSNSSRQRNAKEWLSHANHKHTIYSAFFNSYILPSATSDNTNKPYGFSRDAWMYWADLDTLSAKYTPIAIISYHIIFIMTPASRRYAT